MNKNSLKSKFLAINGGEPVRSKPFSPSCYSSGEEKKLIIDCLESNYWSSFKGATEGWDIDEVGRMKSKKAMGIGALDVRFLGGKYVREFEGNFAEKFNVEYAVSSNSATSCLVMAIGALNLGPGDEIICPSMSFNATATSILFFNSVPVFCEVKDDTFCLDPVDVEKKITSRTKAIMVVHLGGNIADMDSIMKISKKYKLKVIEDSAQSPLVKYKGKLAGSIGDVGIFSFTETKNISCGEGGMLITNNSDLALKARLIRNHGEGVAQDSWSDEELVNIIGMNFRLTELQAAIAIPQLNDLEDRNKKRLENASFLMENLKKYSFLIQPEIEKGAAYAPYILKWKYKPKDGMPSRDSLVKALQSEGIPVSKGYGRLMYENPIFSRKIAFGKDGAPFTKPYFDGSLNYGKGICPISEKINDEFIWFKYVHPPNDINDMKSVILAFDKIFK